MDIYGGELYAGAGSYDCNRACIRQTPAEGHKRHIRLQNFHVTEESADMEFCTLLLWEVMVESRMGNVRFHVVACSADYGKRG